MQKYQQYIDPESGVVKKPDSWDNDPFGDGVWRSSWFYASLIVLREHSRPLYDQISAEHEVSIDDAKTFLSYFHQKCVGAGGWQLPKKPSQRFSRDQLVPLLYLLASVAHYAPQLKDDGREVLSALVKLEENGKGLSDTPKGQIGRNIGYMIDVLCDTARYNVIYRTDDMTTFLVPCFGNIDCAQGNRRGFYKGMFSLALKAHQLGGWAASHGLDVSDEYSVFNALGAVSLQCIAWGKDDGDVKDWRSNFDIHADAGWGPAFKIVSGRGVTDSEIAEWKDAHVTRNLDNDIISAQRPGKIRDSILTTKLKGGRDQWLTLDYVVLEALQALWI